MGRFVSRSGLTLVALGLLLGSMAVPPASATASPPDTAILRGPEAYLCPDCIPDAGYLAWLTDGTTPWDPAGAVDVYGAPSFLNSPLAYLWVAAIPDVGATYECQLDGGGWGACPGLTFDPAITPAGAYRIRLSGLTEGPHTFDVRASVGGVPDPTPASQAFTVDLTPPGAASIDTGPAVVSTSGTATFFLSKPVGEPVHLECAIDDLSPVVDTSASTATVYSPSTPLIAPAFPPATWGITTWEPDTNPAGGTGWDVCGSTYTATGLSDGTHRLSALAVDSAGNPSAVSYGVPTGKDTQPNFDYWTFKVDTTGPKVTIYDYPIGTVGTGSASISFLANEPATFECKLDAGAWGACTSPAALSGLTDGSHTFSARGTDLYGNLGSAASVTWSVDTTPPDTTITSGPSVWSTSATASFAFTSSKPGSTFECQFDGGLWTSCTSPYSTGVLADGSAHTFGVRATDAWGHVDPTPATRAWTVDLTTPDVTINTGPSGTVTVSSATFTFSSTDGTATFECRLDGGAWAACTSPKDYVGLNNASHTFDVRAKDPAGNTSAPASRTWTVDAPAAPNTTIDSGPSGTVGSSAATFTFSANQSPVTFECRLDSGTWGACTSPKNYTGISNGSHTFYVRATNTTTLQVDPTPASRTWTANVRNYRPDAMIMPVGAPGFTGDDIYADEVFHDATNQTVKSKIRGGAATSFVVSLQNDGVSSDRFTVDGCGTSNGFAAKYVVAGNNVTNRIVHGTYVTKVLPSGSSIDVRLTIDTSSIATGMQGCNVKATSTNSSENTWDVNKAEVKIR